MARTELLIKPTIEECVKTATAMGMPEREGRKFFWHYSSNGWRVGRYVMKSFAAAMAGWKERWETGDFSGRSERPLQQNGNGTLSGADKVIRGEEYRRVLDRMKVIVNSYDSHQSMRIEHREELKKLRARREQLRKELGIML